MDNSQIRVFLHKGVTPRLLITDDHYFHVVAEVHAPNNPLDGLVIRCQTHTGHDGSYAWEIGFQPGWADAEFCTRAIKVLRRINRRLSRWAQDFGYPKDFGGYLGRVLKVVRPTDIICEIEGDPLEGCNVSVQDACYAVERAISRFHQTDTAMPACGGAT